MFVGRLGKTGPVFDLLPEAEFPGFVASPDALAEIEIAPGGFAPSNSSGPPREDFGFLAVRSNTRLQKVERISARFPLDPDDI